MKEIDSKDSSTRLFEENGVRIELFKLSKEFEKHFDRLPLMFKRIGMTRPYLEQALEYMSISEHKSRLRTEVCIYLFNEKSIMEKKREEKSLVEKMSNTNPIEKRPLSRELSNLVSLDDPLSDYHLRLSFTDYSYDLHYTKRGHEIYLFDDTRESSLHIGLVRGI